MKKIGKYIFPIFFVLLICSNIAKGQKNIAGAGLHEVGVGLGAINYTGDLSPSFNSRFFRPGGMIFYRYNLSPVVNFRGSLLTGLIQANEENLPDAIPTVRKESFSSQLFDLSVTVEYNFFNYRPKKELYRYSPYLTAGFGLFTTENSGGQLGIPIGLGFKYRLTKRINIGLEFIARKTFTDDIDGIDSSYMIGKHQTANPNDNDWYYYAGFSISWTSYSVICPQGYNQ